MDVQAVILAAVAALVSVVILALVERWWVHRTIKRIMASITGDGGGQAKEPPRLIPKSLCVVQLSDTGVSCAHPEGKIETVEWDDLQRVEVLTTDEGPFAPDVFWILHGSRSGCVIPQGATGERELLERLQALPGFRNEAVIEAMSSAVNQRFLCWGKGVRG